MLRGDPVSEHRRYAAIGAVDSSQTADARWRAIGRDQQLTAIGYRRASIRHLHDDGGRLTLIDADDASPAQHGNIRQFADSVEQALTDQAVLEAEARCPVGGDGIVGKFDAV